MADARRAGVLITGTDTGVGKTRVACLLLEAIRGQGLRAIGMKPVAAGCTETPAGPINDDVEALIAASSFAAERKLVNPYCFTPPIAPHIAAREAGVTISIGRICAAFRQLSAQSDFVVVEGAGGFLVPLTAESDFGDLAHALDLPLLLVVGMRLGCLNHAFLTIEAIENRGLRMAGWLANCFDQTMQRSQENLDTLRMRLRAPLLGIVPGTLQDAKPSFAELDLRPILYPVT